jgi:U3 small nucleolar RNA-associated protein 19
MRLVKEYITHISGADSNIWSGFFKDIIEALVEAQDGEEVRAEFVAKFMKEYEDIRYQTFGQIAYVFHVVFFYHDF